ncbi:hypothetical protein [Sphingobium chungbukense]|uniref:Uncharacterized protein n=1 Tax=Sphingobium chungbukense TaxID=56193 RepID=A0A0M3AZG5_9SPHN|nr:hypothetical protein [Sphingobium chungbukense]KKW93949.1 hypothetical protein YP76_04735 [Sphingobium chungbukense]
MPNGNQSRSDDASRAAELRPEAAPTSNLTTFCRLLGLADAYHDEADAASSLKAFKGFHQVQRTAYDSLCEGHLELLNVLPQPGGEDILVLAGHAAMMANDISDFAPEGNEYVKRLLSGISMALISISGTIAEQRPEDVAKIAELWPELGRSIRRDISTVEAFRPDMGDR